MQLNSQDNRRAVALAAFQGKHFSGYAVKTSEGWTAVASLGMTWSKMKCASANDARVWLRTTSHAGRFDSFFSLDDLRKAIDKLPEYARPAIEPESVLGVEACTSLKLNPPAFSRIG
jgi:hypothetical protein